MPRFEVTTRIDGREVTSCRVRCDGCDAARPSEEHAPRAALWILTAGAFELRDAAGRHAIDPTRALVMPAGHTFAIRHPAGPDVCAPAADRDLTAAIAHALRLSFADTTPLGELADRTGYSVFHACRVFRATTGSTIHGFRRELRLRHALARILDGDEPLARIAASAGFASQSHMTNLFRARFGVTPAKARTRAGMRRLAA